MQFDVIIGNPPYQLDDGGYGTSATPIYEKFVKQAKELNPRLLCMVIPARWFSGGKGLDNFREEMLNDRRIRAIEDFPDSSDVFPGVQIKGGTCYFVWDRDNPGDCAVRTHDKGVISQTSVRPLLEPGADVFIRYNEALPILKKVMQVELGPDSKSVCLPNEKSFKKLVSTRKPFGLSTTYLGNSTAKKSSLKVFRNGGIGFIQPEDLPTNIEVANQWKVFIPYAGSGSDSFPHPILGRPFIGAPGTVCSETYLFIGPLGNENEARNAISYLSTRLLRLLVLLHKPSQHATSSVYTFVPIQDFSRPWTDADLYSKYGIDEEEVKFIETLIRPMDLKDE